MPDIFVSYKSSDRPRAETLKDWFEGAGWEVWIDRSIQVGSSWSGEIDSALKRAELVVVIWGPEARRSPWVVKEAQYALDKGTLLQVHATGLPLLPPFDAFQAVRMQSWSGEHSHSERLRLLEAVATRLGRQLPETVFEVQQSEALSKEFHMDVMEALGLAFFYCARQLERARKCAERGHSVQGDFDEVRAAFAAILELAQKNAVEADDRNGAVHMLVDDFLTELQSLSPDPGTVR